MDTDQVARELLRALRGRRSQVAFSRRLGYRTNVAYAWEAGRRWPSAAELFHAGERLGIDVKAGLALFFSDPGWLADADLATAEGVARLVRELRGDIPLGELARRTGVSRFALGRWQTAGAVPRLQELLALVQAATARLPDFVAAWVDPASVTSLAAAWEALEARRSVAWRVPWAAGVLRCLELDAYRLLPAHLPGWIAARLGVDPAVEAECLDTLARAGSIRWDGERYEVAEGLVVDTRRSPDAGRQIRRHWASVGLDRLSRGAPGVFGYNVFTISRAGLEQLQQMHRAHFAAMRAVIAAEQRAECVVVTNLQLFELDGT